MTFKDLKKKLSGLQLSSEQTKLTELLYEKPFWIWDETSHRLKDSKTRGYCCFNHIVGLPAKNKIENPLFDYEKKLFDALLLSDCENSLRHSFKHKHPLGQESNRSWDNRIHVKIDGMALFEG
jgi:hypothetical protein